MYNNTRNTFLISLKSTIPAVLLMLCHPLLAQHEGHKMPPMNMAPDTMQHMNHGAGMEMQHSMSHSYSLSLPMSRNGSGTGWQPDETPMYMYMKMAGNWNLMFHGGIFLRYNVQDIGKSGSRGGDRLDAPNMFMGMAQRRIGKNGLFNVNLMMSLDPLTIGGNGYPLLFQTGESWKDRPLIDRQHPHDLFSELSIGYTQRLNDKWDLTGYLGYPGEPALGPVTFMHRASAFSNPDAPLGHHWQDATHITFGVATFGIRCGKLKLEASSFTGREPGENRYNFDKPRFDSYSYRLLFNPGKSWALQVSRGLLKSPEEHLPGEDITRTTASVIHASRLGGRKFQTTSLVWGMNQGHRTGHSALLESHYQVNRTGIYGRYEWVQKDSTELALHGVSRELIDVNALTLGLSYNLTEGKPGIMAVGAQSTYFIPDPAVKDLYGSNPVSVEVFMHFTPLWK